MRPARAAPLLALAAAVACRCGGDLAGDSATGDPAGRLWVGAIGAPRVDAVTAYGERVTAAAAPSLDAPVRALLALRGGEVLAVQEPEVCVTAALDLASGACVPAGELRAVAPGVLLDRAGRRVAALEALDGGGAPLFTWDAPPWAAAQDPAGRIWITGRTAPVVYAATGALALDPDAVATLPFATRGVAALADGRVLVSYGVQELAVYDADGAAAAPVDASALGADYEGIDGLLALPGGDVLLGSRRFGVTSAGVVLRGRIDAGALTLVVDPSTCAALGGGLPSALVRVDGAVATAPPLGRLAPPECGRWLSADLRTDHGCIAPEPHRGAAWVP